MPSPSLIDFSMKSASEDNFWEIPAPGRKPPPGPERSAWLDASLLYRNREELYALLDRISPALRRNRPETLDRDSVASAILEYLNGVSASTARAATSIIMLRYLYAGFRRYCQCHGMKMIRIPLAQEWGLEDGLLDTEALEAAALHRQLVAAWQKQVAGLIVADTRPDEAALIAGLVLSAALFGGLATASQWEQFATGLARPPESGGQFVWYDLAVNSRPRRWIADPVTETLIRRFACLEWLPLSTDVDPVVLLYKGISSYLPHDLRSSCRKRSELAHVLERAVKGMLLQHFAPDIVSIALGNHDNTALPRSAWMRLVAGEYGTAELPEELTIISSGHREADTRSRDEMGWTFIHELKSAVDWKPGKKQEEGVKDNIESRHVRAEYIKKAQAAAAKIRRDVLTDYRNRGFDGSACYAVALCHFVDDLIISGGPVKNTLAPATISSYVHDAIESLSDLAVPDLRQVSLEVRQDVYLQALLSAKPGNLGGVSTAIQLFERTLHEHLDLEDEVDWSALPLSSPRIPNVDANLVDPRTYQLLCDTLKTVRCSNESYRELWQALAVLLYRFGLRRTEAHELTLADIHLMSNRRVRVRVSPSRMTSRKSRSSIRSIGPVVLSEEEWGVLDRHLSARKKETLYRDNLRDVYLFARPEHGSQLVSASTLFDPIRKLLHWVTGDTSLRIHHFRHGFACRLFVCGRSPLANFDESASRDDLWLASHSQDGAWLRAHELGHVSPLESVTSYCHTADLAHYYYSCRAVAGCLSHRTLSQLAGLSERSLERTANRKGRAGQEPVAMTAELMLKSARQRWPLNEPTRNESHSDGKGKSVPQITLDVSVQETGGGLKKRVGFRDVLEVIRDRLRNRLDITAWEQKGISAPQVRKWVATIDKLTALGFLKANRQRRDRMPEELIECGERTLQTVSENEIADPVAMIARCLVGFGNLFDPIQVDPSTAVRLKEWIEFRNDKLKVEILPSRKGLSILRLAGIASVSISIGKMFMLVLAVRLLKPRDVDVLVMPYRGGSLS